MRFLTSTPLSRTTLLFGICAASAWGCSSSDSTSPDDGGVADATSADGASGRTDSGARDGGVRADSAADAGDVDASAVDAGAVDADAVDAGNDASAVDAGNDAGAVDAGNDAGNGADTGGVDAGNDAGASADAGDVDAGGDSGAVDASGLEDGGADAGAQDSGDAGSACGANEKTCGGACVSTSDPAYGCASVGCTACALPNATTTCGAGMCAIGACAAGFEDCNRVAADGCEVNTDVDSHNCGSCGNQCPTGFTCDSATCHPPPTVLLLGGSSSQILAGSFRASSGWTTTPVSDATLFAPAVTSGVDAFGPYGVGAYVSFAGGKVSTLVWRTGGWGAPQPISATAVARQAPSIDATGGTVAHLTYQDSSFNYNYAAFSAGTATWSTPQRVGTNYGPVYAAIAARGADATVAFIDGQSPSVNYAAQADLTAGTWQARVDVAGPESFTVAPSIVALSAGPELMMVFVEQDAKVLFVTRTSGVWSAPVYIANALTNDRVALAQLPGGGAILAFRGQDGNLYWSTYTGGAWSAVAAFATPNVSIVGSPSVAHGIAGDTAEIAYVDGTARAYHARLAAGAWSTPALVGGANLVGVAITSTP